MSINLITGNEDAKRAVVNQWRMNKSSGTYLFYGKKGAYLKEFALAFAKGINCNESVHDFCDKCRVCENINKEIYSDLHIISASEGTVKIDQIRELIKNASETSYEMGKKVFIIEDVNKLRKEASNALLKIIEEPPKDTYFILLANSLNILPTIKSRSLAIEIQKLTHEELGVEESLYNFFLGDVKDIREFKAGAYTLSKESYKNTAIYMKEYLETGEFLPKIRAYGALEDFILEKSYLSEIDKIAFAETLDKAIGKNRDFLEHILYQMTLKSRNLKKLEYLLELKEMIRYNVNISVLLVNFILNI